MPAQMILSLLWLIETVTPVLWRLFLPAAGSHGNFSTFIQQNHSEAPLKSHLHSVHLKHFRKLSTDLAFCFLCLLEEVAFLLFEEVLPLSVILNHLFTIQRFSMFIGVVNCGL